MPLEPSLPDQNDSLQEFIALTDQSKSPSHAPWTYLSSATDVTILCKIIKSAEGHPEVDDHPFRALFSAYDTVLPENGLDPNHDQVYFRFLFRLGHRTEEGRPLYHCFERLLNELGIRIELFGEDNDNLEITRNITADTTEGPLSQDPKPVSLSRRASTQSVYDAEDEGTGVLRHRTKLANWMRRSQGSMKDVSAQRPSTRASTRFVKETPHLMLSAHHLNIRNHSEPARAERLKMPETRDRGEQDISSQNEYSVLEGKSQRDEMQDQSEDQDDQSVSIANASESSLRRASRISRPEDMQFFLSDQERLYVPSKTQLLRDAGTFYDYRIRALARSILQSWHAIAGDLMLHHEHRLHIATKHDHRTLCRQAFDLWRARLREKRQIAEMRRFYSRLESRATAARNLYLLSKAFSHWSISAQDEHERISLARKQLLSLKYFYAWKDMTIDNQHKITSLNLQRKFALWKRRYSQAVTHDIKAELGYQRSLLKRYYWQWFWGFCEQRAPAWHERRLLQRFSRTWLASLSFNKHRELQVTVHTAKAVKNHLLSCWQKKANAALSNHAIAQAFNQQRIMKDVFRTWRRNFTYRPVAEHVSNLVDWRVAGATFANLVNRHRLEKHAGQLNRLRHMRNTWTKWNDALRWQTFRSCTDDRLVMEALYRWTIAGRERLLQRLTEQRLAKRCILRMRIHWESRQVQRSRASRSLEDKRLQGSVRSALVHWQSRCENSKRMRLVAKDFNELDLRRTVLEAWCQQLKRIQGLNAMANDAAFYFHTKTCIHRWQARLIESKRQKRRNAYTQIRRMTKISIVSRLLQHWKARSSDRQDQFRKAYSFDLRRRLRFGSELFDHWKTICDLKVAQSIDADNYFENLLGRRFLDVWSRRTMECLTWDEQAAASVEMRYQSLAYLCLNRLRLKIIELKGPLATAENLKIRYEKRHVQNFFRTWQDRSDAQRQKPQRDRPFSVKAKKTRSTLQEQGNLSKEPRAEEWNEQQENTLFPSHQMQTAATFISSSYTTPSKKAARFKSLLEESTTPAETPIQNRLRAQLNWTPQTTSRKLFGRATILRNSPARFTEEDPQDRTDLDN